MARRAKWHIASKPSAVLEISPEIASIKFIAKDSELQSLLNKNHNKLVSAEARTVGVHFQFATGCDPDRSDNASEQVVAIALSYSEPDEGTLVLRLASLSKTQVISRLRLMLSDSSVAKAMYSVHKVAFWLHCYGLEDAELVNCVDLQLLYENHVDRSELNANMLQIATHCSSALAADVEQSTHSFRARSYPTTLEKWMMTPLSEKLLLSLSRTSKLYAQCYAEFRSKSKSTSTAEIAAMTTARWDYAVANRGHPAIWFDPEADSQPRSLECLVLSESAALQCGASSTVELPTLELQCELESLLKLIPSEYGDSIRAISNYRECLVDICIDDGRPPFVYVGKKKRVVMSKNEAPVSKDTIDEILTNLGGEMRIGGDNRAGIDRQLHRISVMRSTAGEVYAFTMRVGRALRNAACVLTDLLLSERHADKSVLVLGYPGSGKTTIIRDVARCVSETMENVCIIDTSNEIGGDGLVPHGCVGWARRMMVRSLEAQAAVMVECVQNHTVETLIVDEIGRKAEVMAASTVRQRGPRLIASAHGDFRALLQNPDLKGLVGGSQQVTVGDSAAAQSATKSKLQTQRAGNPIFDVVVELDHVVRGRCRIIWDVAKAVDSVLDGENKYSFETRQWDTSTRGVQGCVASRSATYGWIQSDKVALTLESSKKASDGAAAAAAAEAALVAEALEREAAAAAALEAQQEAEQEAARREKQQQDELDVVAVGAVAHVIRRAFHAFYAAATEAPEAADASEEAAADESGDEQEQHQQEPQSDTESASARAPELPLQSELSPFVALAQTRKDAIARDLQLKHERARATLSFMQQRQEEAADADTRIAEQLSDKGLVIKAQIPVGPTHLRLDDQELRAATDAGADFGEFADSLLHAKTLVAEYEQRRRERSGNAKRAAASTSTRTAAGEESGENGEHVGYLDSTASTSIRTEATLEQHKTHIAGVKGAHEQHRAAASAGKVSPLRERTHQGGDNVPDLVSTTLTPLSTTQLEQQQLKASKLAMNPVEKRKNMVILERMQTKLDFVRNPRFAAPDQCSDQSSTEPNAAVKPCFDIVPKPPILFTDYDIGGIYEQVVYVRNTGMLSRRARILPPGTIFFSMASVAFPEESGMVAPGMHVEVRLRFAPDSRADYKDSFTVQYETEQSIAPGSTGTPGAAGSAEMVVPLMAHREPPELTLPLVIRAQNTLVGGRSVTSLVCKNLGGKARFWLLSEPAWARLEHQHVATRGISATRSAVEMLGGDYTLGAVMDVGPFRMTPNDIELDKGQSVTFDLVYTPSGIGEQRERFVMVCDNCLVRVFQLVGRGCQVDIAATQVNDSPIDTSITEMGSLDRLFFRDEVLVNARVRQTIVIANDTPIDVKFSWKIQPFVDEAPPEHKKEGNKSMMSSTWTPPFTITPESGVFALSSSKEFTIEFLPVEARAYACQATLMINDIPACSMPGPGQIAHLKAAFQASEDQPLSPRAAAKAAARKLRDAMPGFSIQLRGRGRLGSFTMIPMLNDSWIPVETDGLQRPGNSGDESAQLLLQNQKYSATVLLKNQCNSRVAFSWELVRLRQRHLAAGGGPSASTSMAVTKGREPSFELALDPYTGELEPLGQQRIEITLTPLSTGAFSLSLPCRITTPNDTKTSHAPCFERWLLLEGRVAGAEIEIITSEVDFGLVLVGASTESTITIRNPSRAVTTNWRFLHLDGSTSGGDPAASQHQQSSTGPKLRRSSSKESVTSRHSAISSSSDNETERSLFTSRDILPRATVAFAPENGVLLPGETFTVRATCMAGSLPERFRGHFTCQAALERRFYETNTSVAHAVVSARAEIQCPNVFLSTTRLPLGTTYMGVEIHRTIELVNVSNLEAAFKFVEPEGASRAYSITFSPKQGTIHSKERLVVTLNYTPRQVGRFTVILACSVRGLPAPLGFEVSSNHKGLVLSYELVQPSKIRHTDTSELALPKSPKEIARERGITLSDCDLEPETNPLSSIPKLAFGDSVPLGERRTLCLLIRNFSGIEALVDLEAKKFTAAPVSSSHTGSGSLSRQDNTQLSPSSPSTSPTKRRHKSKLAMSKSTRSLLSNRTSSYRASVAGQDPTKPRLSDAKDNRNRFQSDKGRAYLRQCSENVEDRQILREGRGVAFQLSPPRVYIPPWEQALVRVTCFNNMPGIYVDDVVSRATGAPPVFLHANVGIVGTPLVLDKNCVGLHFGRPVPEGRPQVLLRQPTLTFGSVCVRSPSITKTLRVVNRGPQRARLKWKLVENGREDQLVSVTLRVDFGSRLQLRITPCDEHNSGATALPFIVEPRVAMVPPFSTTPFRVTFEPPKDGVGAPRALLLADAHWYDMSTEEINTSDGTGSNSTLGSAIPGISEADPRQEDASSPTRQNNNSPAHVAAGKAFIAVRIANAIVRKPGAVAESIPASSFSPKCLRVLLSADVIVPELSIDKPREQHRQVQAPTSPLSGRNGARRSSIAAILLPPVPPQIAPYHIKFTTWSTLMSAAAAQHIFHRREVFLVNRLASRVTFRLECDGPFAVAQADSLAPRHPLSMADLPPAHRRSSAQGESYMFMLPPQMSVRIDLRFLPSSSLTDVAGSSKPKPKPLLQQQQLPLHSQFDGELRVKFATRSVQTIRLAAVVLRPAIVVSPSVFFFGRVHLSASRFVVLRLANPTTVPARFTVQHVPRPKPISRAQQQEMREHHAHLTDEPGVFTFSKLSGELQGPTTTLKSAGGWLPTTDSMQDLLNEDATTTHPLVHAPLEVRVEFHPRENTRRYKSRFRFTVEHGRDFEVVLEGTGHLDEVDNPSDGDRPLVPVRELEHSYHIFRGT